MGDRVRPAIKAPCACARIDCKQFPSSRANEASRREIIAIATHCGCSVRFQPPLHALIVTEMTDNRQDRSP